MSLSDIRIFAFCFLVGTLGASCASCNGDDNNGGGDTSITDTGGDAGTEPDTDAGNNDTPDADTEPDGGDDPDTGTDPELEVITCANNDIAAPAAGLCDATAGTNDFVLLRMGQVLAGEDIYANGTVLIDRTGGSDKIACVGCDCGDEADAADAAVVSCAEGVLSPSLINQ